MVMSNTFHFYEPRLGHGLAQDPLNAILGPRPQSESTQACRNEIKQFATAANKV